MFIQSTSKNSTNDYFANTEELAIVHVKRLIDSTEDNTNVSFQIEELGVIKYVFVQDRDPSSSGVSDDVTGVTFVGNTVTLLDMQAGEIMTLLVVGKR